MRGLSLALPMAAVLLAISGPTLAVTHGSPAALRFLDIGVRAIAGEPMSIAPIDVVDEEGRLVWDDNQTVVTLALVESTGNRTATFSCVGGQSRTAVNGSVSTFYPCVIDRPGGGYRLLATSPGLTSALSDPFDVDPPGAAERAYTSPEASAGAEWVVPASGPVPPSRYHFQAGTVAGSTGGARTHAHLNGSWESCDELADIYTLVSMEGWYASGALHVSRQGASFTGVLSIDRTTYRFADCDDWEPLSIETETLAASVRATWVVEGSWIRQSWCEVQPTSPPTLGRGQRWAAEGLTASLEIQGGIELSLGPLDQSSAYLSRGSAVLGLPDAGQPWDCAEG